MVSVAWGRGGGGGNYKLINSVMRFSGFTVSAWANSPIMSCLVDGPEREKRSMEMESLVEATAVRRGCVQPLRHPALPEGSVSCYVWTLSVNWPLIHTCVVLLCGWKGCVVLA